MIARLIFVLCAIAVPCSQAITVLVNVSHCQSCPWFAPDISADASDSAGSDITCQDHLRHIDQSLSCIIDELSEFFGVVGRRFIHMEAHTSGSEEPQSPDSLVSAYNHLTRASLHLRVAEEHLDWGDHEYSDMVRDPLCSMRAILHTQVHSTDSIICEISEVVQKRSRTRSHRMGMQAMRKALHKLQVVRAHVGISQNCALYCNDCNSA